MSIEQSLAARVAIVTGGSRGLGFAAAKALGRAGARIAITARKAAELASAEEELQEENIDVLSVVNDLGKPQAWVELVDQVLARFAQIDILVNNAGATWGSAAETHDIDAWRRVVDINLNGTFALTREVAARSMIPRRQGSVIIIASIAAFGGNQYGGVPTVAYNSTKAAQINLARSLAAEWGRHGIRVNALAPGWFMSKMTAATLAAHREEFIRRIPLGRFGDGDEDLAGPIVFLASDASRYITGSTVVVDGGMTCSV